MITNTQNNTVTVYAVMLDRDPCGQFDDRPGIECCEQISLHTTYKEARAIVDECNKALGKDCGFYAEYFTKQIVIQKNKK